MQFTAPPQACNFIRKEDLAQVFSYEFCEKNTFFYRTPLGEYFYIYDLLVDISR